MAGYLTPQDPASEAIVCGVLRLSGVYWEALFDLLDQLARPESWIQVDGIPAEQAAADVGNAIDGLLAGGGCALIGSIKAYVTAELPDGVLPCDGSVHQRADYPALYAALHSSLVIDADTFRTPDLRADRLLVAADPAGSVGSFVVGEYAGQRSVQLTTAQLPPHTHSTHQHGADVDFEQPVAAPQPVTGYAFASSTGSTGNGDPVDIMPPVFAVLYGIVAR